MGSHRASQLGTGSHGVGLGAEEEGKKDVREANAKLQGKRKIMLAFEWDLWYYLVKAGCKQAAKR